MMRSRSEYLDDIGDGLFVLTLLCVLLGYFLQFLPQAFLVCVLSMRVALQTAVE